MTQASTNAHRLQKVDTVKLRVIIESIIQVHPEGITIDQIANILGKKPHQFSGRLTELKNDGIIYSNTVEHSQNSSTGELRTLSVYMYEDCLMKRRERVIEMENEKFLKDLKAILKHNTRLPRMAMHYLIATKNELLGKTPKPAEQLEIF